MKDKNEMTKRSSMNLDGIPPPVHGVGDQSSATVSNLNPDDRFFSNNNDHDNNSSFQVAAVDSDLANKRLKEKVSDSSSSSLECYQKIVSALGVGSSASAADGDGVDDETKVVHPSDSDSNSEGPNDSNCKVNDLDFGLVLPDDLLHKILSYLDVADFCRAASVCRKWRSVSASQGSTRSLNFHSQKPSLHIFAGICDRHPRCTTVNVYAARDMCLLAIHALRSLRNLETLIVGKGQLSPAFFLTLQDGATLKSLSLRDAVLVPQQDVQIGLRELQNLEISDCSIVRISIRCPQLEILSMKRVITANLVLDCPQLHELAIDSCELLMDEVICSAICSCPLLTTLDISNLSQLTDSSLSRIAQTCVQLRTLNVYRCSMITFYYIRLPLLTVLKLDNCHWINSASMFDISQIYTLQVLELCNCGELTSILLDPQQLRSITVAHCYELGELNLLTPMLSSMTVSDCYSLHHISLLSNSLQKLVLRCRLSLTTLALNCPALEDLDVTDCRFLVDFGCDEFNYGADCPSLRSMVLDGCVSLNTVRLRNTSLSSLSLVGCHALIELDLACLSLNQINLKGCGDLETVLFCPVDLQSLSLGICPKLNLLQIQAPQMVELELMGFGALSKAFVRCPRLTSLDASFCSQFTDDSLYASTTACPLTRSLILVSCCSIGQYGLTSLRCLEHLTLLDLSYTYLVNLHPVFEYCSKLQVLKVQACKYLTDSSLKPLYSGDALPDLCKLDLSHVRLCSSTIEEILACRTRLTHLSLNGCVNVRDLDLGAPGFQHSESSSRELVIEQSKNLLQNLNCIGCPNVRKVVIPAVTRFVNLSSLNLSFSENLKEVDIASFNLSILNLSNCFCLENIKLKCPRLTRLSLQFCSIGEETLEAAISTCSRLETLDIRDCSMNGYVSIARMRAVCPSLMHVFSSLV